MFRQNLPRIDRLPPNSRGMEPGIFAALIGNLFRMNGKSKNSKHRRLPALPSTTDRNSEARRNCVAGLGPSNRLNPALGCSHSGATIACSGGTRCWTPLARGNSGRSPSSCWRARRRRSTMRRSQLSSKSMQLRSKQPRQCTTAGAISCIRRPAGFRRISDGTAMSGCGPNSAPIHRDKRMRQRR